MKTAGDRTVWHQQAYYSQTESHWDLWGFSPILLSDLSIKLISWPVCAWFYGMMLLICDWLIGPGVPNKVDSECLIEFFLQQNKRNDDVYNYY